MASQPPLGRRSVIYDWILFITPIEHLTVDLPVAKLIVNEQLEQCFQSLVLYMDHTSHSTMGTCKTACDIYIELFRTQTVRTSPLGTTCSRESTTNTIARLRSDL